jgi:CRP-like cAMP-binding protein
MSAERPPTRISPTPGTFVALLEPHEWSRLRALGHLIRVPSGAVLMSERESSDLVMILLEGHVKTTLIGEGGR